MFLYNLKTLSKFLIKKIFTNTVNGVSHKQSFAYVYFLILNWFNISLPTELKPMMNYVVGVFMLSLLCFFSFLSILTYFTAYYMSKKYNLDNKLIYYPRLGK